METICRPSDQEVNWRRHVEGKSLPVQVIEPYCNSNCLLVGLHPETWICLDCLRGRTVYKVRKSEVPVLFCKQVLYLKKFDITSPHGMGMREQHYFSVHLVSVNLSVTFSHPKPLGGT